MSSPLEQIKEIWNRLPSSGRAATIGAAVVTLGLIGAIIYYGSQKEYGVLFSDLKPQDAQSVVEKLKAANVPYSLTNSGSTVLVPIEKISDLRLQMAGEGAISGGHVGFDLFDKTNFGATDFAQQVNYRRAIEGEIAKTLEGMDEVESARVHITPKKESVFSEKEENAKASVMLRVRQNKELASERTDAIVSLLANSVEGLDPSNVSVMDTKGRLLSAAGGKNSGAGGDAGAFHAQLEARQKYEAETSARIIALLEPVVGENRVKANVAADVDFSQVEQTEEKFNPQSQVVRSQQTTQEQKTSTSPNPNMPVGARANDPNAPPAAAQTQAQNSANNQRSATTTNYEIDKTTRRTTGGGGRVNRMTVSVVVDYKTSEGVEVARTGDEISKIQELVSAAVGTDTNRGDSVVVQTMAFSKPPDETAAGSSWFDKNKSFVSNAVKYGALVLIAILLLFFVIRPARRAIAAAAVPPVIGEEQKLLAAGDEDAEKRAAETEAAAHLGENQLPQLEPMMTVAELEARMDGGEDDRLQPVNEEAVRTEKIKKELIGQTLNDTELVVSTLRSWLREA